MNEQSDGKLLATVLLLQGADSLFKQVTCMTFYKQANVVIQQTFETSLALHPCETKSSRLPFGPVVSLLTCNTQRQVLLQNKTIRSSCTESEEPK